KHELPRLLGRARALFERARTLGRDHLPAWMLDPNVDADRVEADTAARLKVIAAGLVNAAAGLPAQAPLVAFHPIWLVLEARRCPGRVRAGVAPEQADRVLDVVGSISRAVASYLRVKVVASLVTAIPVAAVLWAFGVSFPVMWGILTFVG